MQSSIKIGKIDIPVGDGKSAYVPKNSVEFIDHDGILATLAISIRDNMPVLLVGETGTGKTSAIRNLAERTQNGFRRVNLNGGTTADELVGRMLLNEKGTIWVDGVLTEAMRNGEWILFDEINAALPEVLFVLQSVLDDDHALTLTEHPTKELVKAHPNFRFFASMNPPNYAGTKELNRALLSRFPVCIDASYPVPKVEKEIIAKHLGKKIADLPITEAIMNLAAETRKSMQDGKTDFSIGTRDILNFLKLTRFLKPREALQAAFTSKLGSEDQAGVNALARLHLPSDSSGAKTVLTHVTNFEAQMIVGGTYVIDADIHMGYGEIVKKAKNTVVLMSSKPTHEMYKQGLVNDITKGDTFKLLGLFRSNERGVSTNPTSTNPVIGALVEFKGGQHKGSVGFVNLASGNQTGDSIRAALYAQC